MLGLIARCDETGLGYQTLSLARMLNPAKILLIDGTKFNGFRQHPEWYYGFNIQIVSGVPSLKEARQFFDGLTAVLTCETFYSPQLILLAKRMNIKTINQINYEFFDPLQNKDYPKCDYYLSPSYWHLPYLKRHHNARYLPPPVWAREFAEARLINLSRTPSEKPRFVHIAGKPAVHDRNGTQTLLDALAFCKADFDLVIYTQGGNYTTPDPRVIIVDNIQNHKDMYVEFDAMILPRKYGGLCLPMVEALMSGLPVMMTDISPNKQVLPSEWLVHSSIRGSFMARTKIDIHEAHLLSLARKIEAFTKEKPDKNEAVRLARQFTPEALQGQYDNLLAEIRTLNENTHNLTR